MQLVELGAQGRGRVILILFTPFILNMIIGGILTGFAMGKALERVLSIEEARFEAMKAIYTYNFYWSIIQVGVGLYVVRLMGGWKRLREALSPRDIVEDMPRSLGLIAALTLASLGLVWASVLVMSLTHPRGWEGYAEEWRRLVAELPLYSKMYMVLVAPFTAGFFEEIIWRWFGIEALQAYYTPRKAVLLQAIAFGLWHGMTIHAFFTALIGLIWPSLP